MGVSQSARERRALVAALLDCSTACVSCRWVLERVAMERWSQTERDCVGERHSECSGAAAAAPQSADWAGRGGTIVRGKDGSTARGVEKLLAEMEIQEYSLYLRAEFPRADTQWLWKSKGFKIRPRGTARLVAKPASQREQQTEQQQVSGSRACIRPCSRGCWLDGCYEEGWIVVPFHGAT